MNPTPDHAIEFLMEMNKMKRTDKLLAAVLALQILELVILIVRILD